MLLLNRTPLHAATVPNADDNDGIISLLVASATYDLGKDRLRFSEEQRPLALLADPPAIGDGYMTKAGTSVCATGFVYAPGGEAPRAEARLFVGDQVFHVVAFGPRVWREGAGKTLVATPPRPFDRVAMTWENAYGGAVLQPTRIQKTVSGEDAILPEHPEAFIENMDGTGFYNEPGGALDAPLPQLEDPEHLVQKWDDRPDPVCFAPYPMHGGMRARMVLQNGAVDFHRHPHVLSRAAPRTTFGELAFGTRVAITGMRPGGEILSFEIPEPPVTADAKVGAHVRRLKLYVDAVDIDAEAANVRVLYRAVFSYPLVRYEQRSLVVLPARGFDDFLPQKP